MALDLSKAKRGAAAIKDAVESSGGGNFRPFAPFISWNVEEEKYVLILTPIDDILLLNLHEFVEVGKRDNGKPIYESFLDRTDGVIGEDVDPLSEKGAESRERNLAVAIELEPLMGTNSKGKTRPKGFEVLTREFTRKVRDDDGNATDEKEEVVAPVIGVISQSPHNFFGYFGSYNETDGPHEDVAFRIKRRTSKEYDMFPYEDQEVDLTNLIENVEGITYLDDQLDDLIEAIDGLTDEEAAQIIAQTLLVARINELGDKERYDDLTKDIEKIVPKFPKKGRGNNSDEKAERPARQRKTARSRKAKEEPAEETPDETADEGEEDSKRLDEFEALRAKARKGK